MDAAPSSHRASAWEWAQVLLLLGSFAWTTLCLGGFRPETMLVTSGLNALLLAVHFAGQAVSREPQPRLHWAGWCLLPFLGYAFANVLWVTPVPWIGWRDWLGWTQLITVFWVVLNGIRSPRPRSWVFGGVVLVAFVTVVLGCYQRFVKPDWLMLGRTQADQFVGRASGSFGIPNSLAAFLLLLIPPLAALGFRRGAAVAQRLLGGYLALALGFGLVLTISRGGFIALALVLVAWPLFMAPGSGWRRLAWTGLAGLAVAAALMTLYLASPNVRSRFEQMKADAGERTRPIMWRGAWQIFREHPAWGGGAASFNVLFEKFRPNQFQDEPIWAHNDYVNTLSDYGAVGFLLFFGAAAGVAWRAWRWKNPRVRDWLDEPLVAGAIGIGLLAFALQLFVDFHFKIPALAMACGIMAGLVVQRSANEETVRLGAVTRIISALVAIGVLAGWVVWFGPMYRGEALRYSARQSINRLAVTETDKTEMAATVVAARADLTQAVASDPRNGQAWADLAYVISLQAHVTPERTAELGREAERAASRALETSKVVPEFWIRRGVALDMQGRRGDAGADFVRALTLAPANGLVWFYQAFHLSLNQGDPGLALAAVDFSLRLDPGNREAQSLRKRLASSRREP
ncbi:MAG: O-antigen ligase family protein [Verrucomicrobia bacterium]|nr:O-antigen ligase family protein [Verrucomicrobiota bacterium]